MKHIVCLISFVITLSGYSIVGEAANVEKDIAVNAKTEYELTDVIEGVRVDEDDIRVEMDDGTVIKATGEFEDTVRLMVMPITKDMTKEWTWLQSVTKKFGENKSAYDIFFINSQGKRVNGGEGSQISIMTRNKFSDLSVYYIEASGKETKIESQLEEYVVKFKMMKNGYYTLLTKFAPKKTNTTVKKKPTTKKDIADKNDVENDEKDMIGKDVDTDDETDKTDKNNKDNKDNEEDIDKDDGDKEDNRDSNDDSDVKNDDGKDKNSNDKRPDGGGEKQGGSDKEDRNVDIITLLSIVFVFITTIIIFIIILKKKKDKENDEEI